jgi:hypothetical protein
MIEIKENYDTRPICPFCESEIRTISMQRIATFLGKRYLYFCSRCRKVLGVSHRKGFWMG